MKIDLKELPLLTLRLQIHLDPYGIKLDTSKFEAMIRENNGNTFLSLLLLLLLKISDQLIYILTSIPMQRYFQHFEVLWGSFIRRRIK